MTYCAICNGTEIASACCLSCGSMLADYGRFNDFLGPYSPYREIDDISMTNGFHDVTRHECVHLLSCEACNRTFTIGFPECD